MAKNIGLIQFTGKLGGLSGRQTKFGNVIQTPGGFKGERIKTEERYEKTRQLNAEFGHCAKLASLLKRQLDLYLKRLPDPYIYNHIQKRMTAIKACDATSAKGEKTVGKGLLTVEGAALWQHFSFNRKRAFGLPGRCRLELEHGRLTLEGLSGESFPFPNGVPQVGLQLLLLRLDLEKAAGTMTSSEAVFLQRDQQQTEVVLQAELPEGEGTLIAVLFAGFCDQGNQGAVPWRRNVGNVLAVVGFGDLGV